MLSYEETTTEEGVIESMRFVNLTPHVIRIQKTDGSLLEIEPSGTVARVSTRQRYMATLDGVPLIENRFGSVVGLPEEDIMTPRIYIVSAMVQQAIPNRLDVYSPDTGPTVSRDENGQIHHVMGLVRLERD